MTIPRRAFREFASSDHATFSAAGAPAITISSGNDPLIHQEGDDLGNVSRDDLEIMLRVATAVLRVLLTE